MATEIGLSDEVEACADVARHAGLRSELDGTDGQRAGPAQVTRHTSSMPMPARCSRPLARRGLLRVPRAGARMICTSMVPLA
jgi:hypothetical protein